MVWTIEYSETARKALKRVDRQSAKRITSFLDTRIAVAESPRRIGKALHAQLDTYWSYRVGDFRVICEIHDAVLDAVLKVLVVKIGHRGDVYR